LEFIKTNLALAELYAGNNHVSNVKGSLSQLKNLRILHLQNNQISNLNNLVYDLRHLTALEDLSKSILKTYKYFVFCLDLFDNPVTFVHGYKSTMIDLFPKLRVLDRQSMSRIDIRWIISLCVLAISNEDRARAYNDRHPDRRKVLDRIGFAFHLERKQEENSSRKKFIFEPIGSITTPQIQVAENDKTQE
jgi:hypothetical protein